MEQNGVQEQVTQDTGQNTDQPIDPQIQEQFDLLAINGMNIINEEKPAKGIVGKINESADRVQAVAEVTVDLINRLVDSALESQVTIGKDALVHGANFLMGEIISLAESAGIEPFTDDEKAQAFQAAVSMYLDTAVKQGKMTKEELVEMSEEAKQSPQGQEMASQIESRQNPQGQQLPQGQGQGIDNQQGGGILAQGGM